MRPARALGPVAAGLAALLLGACGGASPPTTSTARTAATTGSTATTATATATTVTTLATSTSVQTIAPELPGTNKPTVLLGDMNTPEQFVIGTLYQLALDQQGYTVQLNRNIGATSVSEAALAQGSLDIYPQYLNVYDAQVAGERGPFKDVTAAYLAAQAYAHTHGETLLAPTPGSDTPTLAVLSTYARAHHLHTLADLARVQNGLTVGAPLEFTLPGGGLETMESTYHWSPAVTTVVNIGGQFAGLRNGTLQAAYATSTDPELSQPMYTALGDPRHVFGFGNVVPVVSTKLLAQEGPAFVAAIDRVNALLTPSVLRGLVAELSGAANPAAASNGVAQDFLQGNGILPAPPWSTLTGTTTLTTPGTGALTSAGQATETTPVG